MASKLNRGMESLGQRDGEFALIRGAAEDYADYRAKAAWCEGALWVLDVEDRERGRL